MRRILVLAAAAGFAGQAAHAAGAPVVGQFGAARAVIVPGNGGVIINQTSGGSGSGLVSQNSGGGGYASAGADAFTVRQKVKIKTVLANGIYVNGTGPANSVSVMFYADRGGAPGRAIKRCGYQNVKGTENDGTFNVALKPACTLKAGRYWMSFVVNMPFGDGEWFWYDAAETGPYQGDWENPGGSGPCTSWQPNQVCFPGNYPTGYNYELLGTGS